MLFNFANSARGDITVTGAGSRIDVTAAAANPLATPGEMHVGGADAISGDILGTFGTDFGGDSLVQVLDDARVTVASKLKIWQNGELRLTTGAGIDGVVTVGTGPEETTPGTLRVHADGLLTGDGLVTAPTVAADGTTAPGSAFGTSLEIDGDFTASSSSQFAVELAGTDPTAYSNLAVSGTAHLDGTLDVSLAAPFEPTVGDVFDVISYSGVSGFFDTFIGLDDTLGVFLLPFVLPNSFRLQSVLAGDANLDGVVDALDANIISLNFMASGVGYSAGDVNLDGVVNALDANIVSLNFNPGGPASAIPEPAALALALTFALALFAHRRRRST